MIQTFKVIGINHTCSIDPMELMYCDAEILSGHGQANVGVLVSGPKKMKQDVAAICSSSLTKNLHYESFSFSW